jgi:hypothetical protein
LEEEKPRISADFIFVKIIDIHADKHAAILAHAVKGADVRKLTLRPLTGINTLDTFASYDWMLTWQYILKANLHLLFLVPTHSTLQPSLSEISSREISLP